MEETLVNFKNFNKEDFEKSKAEWEEICKDLAKQWKNQAIASSSEVQKIIHRHFKWLKRYWTPDRDSYPKLGDQYMGFEWKEAFEAYDSEHPKLAQFLAEGMKIFAQRELS